MKAQLKCSSCGAEISTLTFSSGKWAWLSMIPFLAFVFMMPVIMQYWMADRSNFRTDLAVQEIEKRFADGQLEILGLVKNNGSVNWERVVVEAEMFDADGKFVNEFTERIESQISPRGSEHFKLFVKDFPSSKWEAIKEVKVKIADAYHPRF